MRAFDNEWIFRVFEDHPSFFTKRMFGGLAVYLFERQMLVLVEPTKTGRWQWNGVLVCTDRDRQRSIRAEFPALAPHAVLGRWLFIDSTHDDFEPTMAAVANRIARDDPRFGIVPSSEKSARRSRRRPPP